MQFSFELLLYTIIATDAIKCNNVISVNNKHPTGLYFVING